MPFWRKPNRQERVAKRRKEEEKGEKQQTLHEQERVANGISLLTLNRSQHPTWFRCQRRGCKTLMHWTRVKSEDMIRASRHAEGKARPPKNQSV